MIRINHFTDFYNLIKSVGLSSTPPFANFMKTVEKYISMCGCDQVSQKTEAGASSKSLYESLSKSEISSQIQLIKKKRNVSKIEFYANGVLLAKY